MHRQRTFAFLAAVTAVGTAFAVSGPVTAGAAPAPASATAAAARTVSHAQLEAGIARAKQRGVIHTRNGRFGPFGPNPRLANVPGTTKLDWGGWKRAESALAKRRAATARADLKAKGRLVTPRLVREDEPAGSRGGNDSLSTAQLISIFGTAARRSRAVTVLGRLSPGPVAPVSDVAPAPEPNDSPRTAYDLGLNTKVKGAHTTGVIGDYEPLPKNPFNADTDLYKVTLRANQLVKIKVKRTSGDLLPYIDLFSEDGLQYVLSEDDEETSTLSFTARKAGTYYALVAGYLVFEETTEQIVPTKGGYDLRVTLQGGDRDVYKVNLRAGDVLGVNATDAARYVSVFDTKGVEVKGSPYDATGAFPENTPLPGGGNATTEHIAARSGVHYVEVTQGEGAYQAQLEVHRYGGEAKKQTQIIYLDTDGQRFQSNVVFGRGVTTLSPLRSFLGNWGLQRSTERAVINRIKATVQENLDGDLRRSGLSKYVSVKVVTTLDLKGKDPYGKAGVTRVIVGGTIPQLGLPVIGVAQSIDPGNFDREETAVVLLDVLSGKASEYGPDSLNFYLRKNSDRIAFVGRGVGNTISHEVGHLIGNWHTDGSDSVANLMDTGGGEDPGQLYGPGRDGIGGTRDDVDVDFRRDRFEPFEGFTGIEDSLARSTFGMSTRR
jgi:hypothetical protein